MSVVENRDPVALHPRVGPRAVWHLKWPFERMAVGDSFVLPFVDGLSSSSLQTRVYGAARAWGVRVRTMTVEGGVRVWRIA